MAGFPPPSTDVWEATKAITDAHTEAEAARYIAVAACFLFFYDFATTIDYEVQFIWSSRWSIPRVVFHLNRFWPMIALGAAMSAVFIPNISPELSFRSLFRTMGFAISNFRRDNCCILLYHSPEASSRRKPIPHKHAQVLSHASIHSPANLTGKPVPEILPGCIIIYTPKAWMPYLSALAFETTVFSMMLYKTYAISRDYGSTPLVQRLLIDGTLYYAIVIVAASFSLTAATTNQLRAPIISSGLFVTMLSVTCSRIVLSLYTFTEGERLERIAHLGLTDISGTSTRFRKYQGTLDSSFQMSTLNSTRRDATSGEISDEEAWNHPCHRAS